MNQVRPARKWSKFFDGDFIGDDATNVFAVGAFGMFPISSLAVVDGEVAKDPISPQPKG